MVAALLLYALHLDDAIWANKIRNHKAVCECGSAYAGGEREGFEPSLRYP